MSEFGKDIRKKREKRYEQDRAYSVRKTAARIGVEPSYLSKIERGEQPPPSEKAILLLAKELDLDSDVLLARAGKIPGDVKEAILRKPETLPGLVRKLGKKPRQELVELLEKYNKEKR